MNCYVGSSIRRAFAVGICVLGLVACGEEKPEKPSEAEKPTLDDTATVLPPGVRDGWFEALNRAIDERIVIYKGWIGVRNLLGGASYVPLSALSVECTGWLGVSLNEAGASEEGGKSFWLISPIGNPEEQQDGSEISEWFGMPAPELGVGDESPAARELMDDLCRHVIDRLEATSVSEPGT